MHESESQTAIQELRESRLGKSFFQATCEQVAERLTFLGERHHLGSCKLHPERISRGIPPNAVKGF